MGRPYQTDTRSNRAGQQGMDSLQPASRGCYHGKSCLDETNQCNSDVSE